MVIPLFWNEPVPATCDPVNDDAPEEKAAAGEATARAPAATTAITDFIFFLKFLFTFNQTTLALKFMNRSGRFAGKERKYPPKRSLIL